MKKEIQIKGRAIQEFMLSLQRNVPNSWNWGEVNPETGIPNSACYPLRYHDASGKEYEFLFLCEPINCICRLTNILGHNLANDDIYNNLVDMVYSDIIAPKHTTADITITIIVLD